MSIKILVIDDSEQDRKIILRYLGRAGYANIVTAETGNEGLLKVKEEKPDLILLDTMLPDTLGFEICRKIREMPEFKETKIIMTTGSAYAVDAIKARQAGADDYCAKISDCSPILEAVRKILS